MKRFVARLIAAAMFAAALCPPCIADDAPPSGDLLKLSVRTRDETAPGSGRYHAVEKEIAWDPRETAIVVCDMWDKHWCKGASRRVGQMAPRMNEVLQAARGRGILIIHAPSETMPAYADTPQRKLAQAAAPVETKVALRHWCALDRDREAPLPIDDSDGGCDCEPRCPSFRAWTRQIDAIEIAAQDAVTDSAEAYYLMRQRGIKNVIVMGVHTNMCVLGRPFSIRQMVYQGQNVVLMRDMTDTMYNPRARPEVSHFTGTDLVVEHIERHWCPSVTSTALTGKPEFRFPEDQRPTVAIITAEDEYKTEETLPVFALQHLGRDFRTLLIYGSAQQRDDIPGLEALAEADVLLLSVRRRVLPVEQLSRIRAAVEAGKPIVAIRTSSHGFAPRGDQPVPQGRAIWAEFDQNVLGGNYTGHHGKQGTHVRLAPGVAEHDLLRGVPADGFVAASWLYKVSPLSPRATPLLVGRFEDRPEEPVAWIHAYLPPDVKNLSRPSSRVFYTSLGHVDDFQLPAFQRLLSNAVYWAAGKPVPAP